MAKNKNLDDMVMVKALIAFPYGDRGVFINNVLPMPKADAERYIEAGAVTRLAGQPGQYNRRDMNARGA